MKVAVLGSNGQLGMCLQDKLVDKSIETLFFSRRELDISDFGKLKKELMNFSPDVVINGAAYTAVDDAENNKKLANLINNLSVLNIAKVCFDLDCWLFHVSTDYIFDGSKKDPYTEESLANPQSVYGQTKLKGELAIQASKCKYIILRTSWVFSEYDNNFLTTMIKLGSSKDSLDIINDQIGCPTYAQDLASAFRSILGRVEDKNLNSGIFNFCGEPQCSWYDFALIIFQEARFFGIDTPKTINPVKTSDYYQAAKRPAYSILDCSKIMNVLEIDPSNWRDGVNAAIKHIAK